MKNAAGDPSPTFYELPLQEGCGGFSTENKPFDWVRNDTTGAYEWNPVTLEWEQQFTPENVPQAYWNNDVAAVGDGCAGYARVGNRRYGVFRNQLFKRDGGGTTPWTWVCTVATMTGVAGTLADSNLTTQKFMQCFAVDDFNSDVLYCGWHGHVPRISTNAGTSWANGPGLPATVNNAGTTSANGIVGSISGTTLIVTTATSNCLEVGQTLAGSQFALTLDTRITAQLTGTTGGVGTYTVSQSQTKGSQALSSTNYCNIVIDRTSTTTSGRRDKVFFAIQGKGLYGSTDGCASTALLSNAILNFGWLTMNPNDGFVWGTNMALATNNVFNWNGSAIGYKTNAYTISQITFADSSTTVLSNPIGRSINGGTSFQNLNPPDCSAVNEGRMPLIREINEGKLRSGVGLSVSSASYDAASGNFFLNGGYDVYRVSRAELAATTPNTGRTHKYYMGSYGMSNVIGMGLCWPPASPIIHVAQDFKASILPLDGSFARKTVPYAALGYGYAADWAPGTGGSLANAGHQIVLAKLNQDTYLNVCCSTNDKWDTTALFPTQPTTTSPVHQGGIACTGVGKAAIAGSNQWPRKSVDGYTTWSPIALSGITQIADGTDNGIHSSNFFIWRPQPICSDKSTPGRAWLHVYGAGAQAAAMRGIWETTDDWATSSRIHTTEIGTNTNAHRMLKQPVDVVGGVAVAPNHLLFCAGTMGGYWDDSGAAGFYRSLAGGAGASWEAMPNATEVHFFGFGARFPGYTCAALYFFGCASNASVSHRLGFWMCLNYDAANVANVKYIYLGPNPKLSQPVSIEGRKDEGYPGQIAITWAGHSVHRFDVSARGMAG